MRLIEFPLLINEDFGRFITVYHGTKPKFVNDIKKNGLEDRTGTPYQQGWYMVSTDFESALFHARPDDNRGFVPVFEFKIPNEQAEFWDGYPYLWPGERMRKGNMWFALMEKLPPRFITKVHYMDYESWREQQDKKF